MSLIYINNFYQDIYNALINKQEINTIVKGVYLNIATTNIYPCLVINICNVTSLSHGDLTTYQIKFIINLYFNNNDLKVVTILAENIKSLLTDKDLITTEYKILSLKFITTDFQYSNDLLSSKLTLNFLTLIQKAII